MAENKGSQANPMASEYKITLARRRADRWESDTVEVAVPALPRVGDHVSHEPSGINGYVETVSFWWSEDGSPLHIEVRLK